MLACFVGVIMIAMSGNEHDDEQPTHTGWLAGNEALMRTVGIVSMLFVAANDASINVLARKMKDLHYSIIQFWFSAIGLVILLVYMVLDSIIRVELPNMLSYDGSQWKYLTLTGVFSAANLTCLVIAYQNDKSATIALLAYIALVYAFLADIFIF